MTAADRSSSAPRFAFTIDVEDYFQVWALSPHIPRHTWDEWPARVEPNTHHLLDLLAATGRHATFFTLGWIAERFPALIRRIVAEGHEIASHGYDHRLVYEQTSEAFRADVTRAKALLEDAGGHEVRGFRAASFSLGRATPWAHAILGETGHAYSSSSHPVRNDHYGDHGVLATPCLRHGVLEVPVTTVPLLGRNLPCGGGGYFRLLPYAWTVRGLSRSARLRSGPVVFYLHPWEIDPGQPRPAGLSMKTRLRHYTNLGRCAARVGRLLAVYPWTRLDRTLGLREPAAHDGGTS